MNTSSDRIFLTAEWRSLVMLNYELDPSLLRKYVPAGTELDLWNGKCFVSIVGFRFLKTRVFGVAIPFHRNFDEVNLRFYVRRFESGEIRRGVVFIREFVPRWAIATIARAFYNERYMAVPMFHHIESKEMISSAEYGWRVRNRWHKIALTAKGDSYAPQAGSVEQFITEHYWGYASGRDGGCIEYRVAHPVWSVKTADQSDIRGRPRPDYTEKSLVQFFSSALPQRSWLRDRKLRFFADES